MVLVRHVLHLWRMQDKRDIYILGSKSPSAGRAYFHNVKTGGR